MRSSWKIKNILNNKDILYRKQNKLYIKKREFIITKDYIGFFFYIYNGKKFIKVQILPDMVNHKLGSFSFTKKFMNIHKINKKKNKKKKK